MIEVGTKDLSLEKICEWARDCKTPEGQRVKIQVGLAAGARTKMLQSYDFIQSQIKKGETIYGVNTGFGAFSSVKISPEDILQLQRNLIRSHAVGLGEPFSKEETRVIMLLRAHTLAQGYSGVRPELVEKILEFLNKDCLPWIPQEGSVGACGDLAPLAHLALAIMGEGYLWQGESRAPTAPILQKIGVKPLELHAKEGLAMINGCQASVGVGILALERAKNISRWADVLGALSLEALRGSRSAFDPLITEVRPHPGEIKTAQALRELLGETSEIGESHHDCHRVQDPYSLRCMPAVHGSLKDALEYTAAKTLVEAHSSTDNPLVFSEAGKILSCGNFHGMPIAHAFDFLSLALTSVSSISEQRISKLMNPTFSELKAFLAPRGGLDSGMMIVHVQAASRVSENKTLANPASADTIPTSTDKEDHVSMATWAARKLRQVVSNTEKVFACELLCALQGLDLLAPLKTSPQLEQLRAKVRKQIPFAAGDRFFGEDLEKALELIQSAPFFGRFSS